MPFRLRSILGSATRRERGRGTSSWWRPSRPSPPVTVVDSPQPVSSPPSLPDSQQNTQTTAAALSSSHAPSSLSDSSQELTLNQTLPQSACDADHGDPGGLPRGGHVHSEDIPPLEDLSPRHSFPTPEPLMSQSFSHNFDPAADAPNPSAQGIPIPSSSTASGTDARSNLAVPIIVIGLQALAAGRDSPNPPHLHHPLHHHTLQHDHVHNATEDGDDVLDGFAHSFTFPPPIPPDSGGSHPHLPGQFQPSQEFLLENRFQSQQDNPSRPRTWQDRAIAAFRNLRRARRNESSTSDSSSTDSALPRTLLIYIISGLSPSDHPVILGGNLDSFEALWELAEFLGQVKPPTASKEDIERSGLEVIQASSLEEYEKTERVANNCTERCLICLDDYAPEENVRVLACKHAFHQACVDKWLETGRNNCPACRCKGVEDTSSSSTTANTSTPTAE